MVVKETVGDRIFNIINILLLSIILFIIAYPLYFVVIASFSNPDLVARGRISFWPVDSSFGGYSLIFEYDEVWVGYRNTIFYATAGTLLNLCVSLPAAYALSRRDFRFRNFFTFFFLITMFFSGGLIPTYLLISQTLRMNDTIWVMIIPGATGMMQLVIARTFFTVTIPDELRESAEIDGCSNFRLFTFIVLPLSTAIIAVQGLQSIVSHWNSWFNAMMYLSDRGGKHLQPLQLILRSILIQGQVLSSQVMEIDADANDRTAFLRKVEQLKYALIIVSTIPVLIIYPFIQKYFVKGIMIGAIKG